MEAHQIDPTKTNVTIDLLLSKCQTEFSKQFVKEGFILKFGLSNYSLKLLQLDQHHSSSRFDVYGAFSVHGKPWYEIISKYTKVSINAQFEINSTVADHFLV